MLRIGAVLLAGLATNAGAQITTTCNRIGTYTNCQTNERRGGFDPVQGVDGGAMIDAYQRGAEARERREAAGAANEQRRADAERENWERREMAHAIAIRKRVGSLLAAGDCNGALREALADGQFPLAQEVKQFCPSASVRSTPANDPLGIRR